MRLIDADAIKYNYYMMPDTTDSHKIAVSKDKIDTMPTIEVQPLTDGEKRIFLSAMRREEEVCKKFDDQIFSCEAVSLVRVCHEITRKVKAALWKGETNNGK